MNNKEQIRFSEMVAKGISFSLRQSAEMGCFGGFPYGSKEAIEAANAALVEQGHEPYFWWKDGIEGYSTGNNVAFSCDPETGKCWLTSDGATVPALAEAVGFSNPSIAFDAMRAELRVVVEGTIEKISSVAGWLVRFSAPNLWVLKMLSVKLGIEITIHKLAPEGRYVSSPERTWYRNTHAGQFAGSHSFGNPVYALLREMDKLETKLADTMEMYSDHVVVAWNPNFEGFMGLWEKQPQNKPWEDSDKCAEIYSDDED